MNYRSGGSGVSWRETGGEIVVLDLDTSMYFGLNPSGAVLWKRLINGASRGDLVSLVVAQGAASARAGDDVDAFLSALDSHGLLHPATGGSGLLEVPALHPGPTEPTGSGGRPTE